MPQNPQAVNTGVKSGARAYNALDAQNSQVVASAVSQSANVAASTVIKATAGRCVRVNVTVAGSATGAIHNCATTGTAAAGNLVFVVPNTVGTYFIDWPCATGITYIVGTGQTVAISYV